MEDVLSESGHLHLPGFQVVEDLALLLLQLVDDTDRHIIPADLRQEIAQIAGSLEDHDRTSKNFQRKYESKWGYTLFGRCSGPESAENSAAQRTKFGWARYPQAAQITEESRLLYLLIKMLKNRPQVAVIGSPGKITSVIKGQYKRIVDRVRDDPILSGLNIPLPNINAKSISSFLVRQEKRANLRATLMPRVKSRQRVASATALPPAPSLPVAIPTPDRPQIQYPFQPHVTGKRQGEKRRLELDEPQPSTSIDHAVPVPVPVPVASMNRQRTLAPMPSGAGASSAAPILLVLPAQPQGPSLQWAGPQMVSRPPPGPPRRQILLPNKSSKPCACCKVPKCGGLRKRYTPPKQRTEKSAQKIFTFCPTTRRSPTAGFDNEVYDSFEHFKQVVDKKLDKPATSQVMWRKCIWVNVESTWNKKW